MSTLEEMELAIGRLPQEDIIALRDWLQFRFEEAWDRQFEDDVNSGRLRQASQKALEEHRAGKSRNFPGNEE